ncbi:hypothetical protein [Ignavibacterium album]|uniref:hypothetical protein n=1 Tax=Ignavibacterium album TaxID=591197 RepID=UPI0038B2F9CA
MIKKLITYFILISYLALFTANILHFHHIILNDKSWCEVTEQTRNIYPATNHSALQCPVHNIFTNLHYLYSNYSQNLNDNFSSNEKFSVIRSNIFRSLFFYNSVSLRAPPSLSN